LVAVQVENDVQPDETDGAAALVLRNDEGLTHSSHGHGIAIVVGVHARAKAEWRALSVNQDFGWQRTTWTFELLAAQLVQDTGVRLSPSHVRNLLLANDVRRGGPR
jgi:hypothetical protein